MPPQDATLYAAATVVAVTITAFVWWIANKHTVGAKARATTHTKLPTVCETAARHPFRLSHWMEDLASSICTRSLHELALPGSHNCGAYSLTTRSAPRATFFHGAFPYFIRRWSVCQDRPVDEQLRAGVRYLDLRTAHLGAQEVRTSDELRVVHGLVGVGTLVVLRQVKAFLDKTSLEVVVLDFQHFYQVKSGAHELLLASILQIFGAEAITPPCEARAPLSELWAKRRRVLLLWGDAAFAPTRPELVLERPPIISSPWAGIGRWVNPAARRKLKAILEGYMVSSSRLRTFPCARCDAAPLT